MALLIQRKAAKELAGVPREEWERLRERLERIARNPRARHPGVELLDPAGPRIPGPARQLAGDLHRHRQRRCRGHLRAPQTGGLQDTMTDKDGTGRAPIQLLSETADTVTLRRADFDAMLEDLEDAEDRNAVLEHDRQWREAI